MESSLGEDVIYMTDNNNKISQAAWLEYTKLDFIERVKSLAKKHGVKITRLDISKKQIYFDCNYFNKLKFAIELNQIVEEFKTKAPSSFKTTRVETVIKTLHGWVKEADYLKTINKKGED